MEELVIILLTLVLGLFFISKAIYYWFTPEGDLYSDYRNELDYGTRLFKKRLMFQRIAYSILAVVSLTITFYVMFR